MSKTIEDTQNKCETNDIKYVKFALHLQIKHKSAEKKYYIF